MSPYWPSQVTNCLTTIKRSCHRGLSMDMGIPLSQDVTFHETNSSGHGTSSTFEFLNQRWPVAANLVAELINSSLISSWMSPILALQPSKVRVNYCATNRLKPSNLCTNVSQPLSCKSFRALSNSSKAWLPFGSIRTTGAMEKSTRRVMWTSQGLNTAYIGVERSQAYPMLAEVKQG